MGLSSLFFCQHVYLVPSCAQACPKDMVASNDTTNYPNSASYYRNNGDGTGGFVDVRAW